jgi:tRNA(Ile)-lysidine synthase
VLSAAVPAPPLGLAEFGARLGRLARFEAAPLVAVAVSGGPDSLALALLAERWARGRGGRICALSVDHRLRPESADELRRLGAWLGERAIDHRILVWDGEKPRTRIQETARTARYRLLTDWCRAAGCLHLLTGHHREDQRETHLLRQGAKSGPDGLAGMSAIREINGCRVLRPLLDVPKSRLIATLAAAGQPYVEDPSNRDPVFARARLRAAAADADADVEAMAGHLRRLGQERAAREAARDQLLARAVALHPAGFAVIDPDELRSAPAELAARAMSALVFALSGGLYPPRRRSLVHLLRILDGEAAAGHVLGGLRFVAWRSRILVLRELAHAGPPVRIEPGTAAFWDRRFSVVHPVCGRMLTLNYLGRDGIGELRRRWPGARYLALPPIARQILPAFWDEIGLAGVPAIGCARERDAVLPRLLFRPANALSYASFAVV